MCNKSDISFFGISASSIEAIAFFLGSSMFFIFSSADCLSVINSDRMSL